MKKTRYRKLRAVIFSLLAMLLLLTSSFVVSSVKAMNLAMQYGHLAPDPDEDEKDLEEFFCDSLYYLFEDDPVGVYGPVNAYGTYTTYGYVGQCLDWQNANADTVTNWWVGDFYHPPPYTPGPFGHFAFYGEGTGNGTTDSFVYDHATDDGEVASKQRFNFIWTCANGGCYWLDSQGSYGVISGITCTSNTSYYPGPTNYNTEYGFFDYGDALGMPLAWTGITNMNLDGYNSTSGDYCYIGFEGPSPFLKDDLEGTSVDAYNFPWAFYVYALGYCSWPPAHQTIASSLDYAADSTFGDEFDQTPLYNGYWVGNENYGYWFARMRVLGNGALVL